MNLRLATPDWTRFTIKKRPSGKPIFSVQLVSLSRFTLFRNCKEQNDNVTSNHFVVRFVLRRNSDCSDTQTRFFLKVKSPQSRHRDAARTRLFYFSRSGAPSSTVNLRLATPDWTRFTIKKDRAKNLFFRFNSVQFGAANRN